VKVIGHQYMAEQAIIRAYDERNNDAQQSIELLGGTEQPFMIADGCSHKEDPLIGKFGAASPGHGNR
jgi:hypothetical protein